MIIMKDDFMIYLRSNSIKSNTPSDFITNFTPPFEISNPKQWEVGMKHIRFNNSIKTINEDKASIIRTLSFERDAITNIEGDFKTKFEGLNIRIPETKKKWLSPSNVPITDWDSIAMASSMIMLDDAISFNFIDNRITMENKTKFTVDVTMPKALAIRFGFKDHEDRNIHTNEVFTIKLLPLEKKIGPFEAFAISISQNELFLGYKPTVTEFKSTEVTVDPVSQSRSQKTKKNKIDATEYVFSVRFESYTTVDILAEINLKPGAYADAKDLEKELNKNDTFNEYFKFSYDQRLNRFDLTTVKQETGIVLHLEKGLHDVLGFSSKTLKPSTSIQKGNLQVNLMRGIDSLFIYSDIIQPLYVGPQKSPLLRLVSFNVKRYGQWIHRTYKSPMYMNLNKNSFDKISIQMYDEIGELIPFGEGLTLIALHFKKKDEYK